MTHFCFYQYLFIFQLIVISYAVLRLPVAPPFGSVGNLGNQEVLQLRCMLYVMYAFYYIERTRRSTYLDWKDYRVSVHR